MATTVSAAGKTTLGTIPSKTLDRSIRLSPIRRPPIRRHVHCGWQGRRVIRGAQERRLGVRLTHLPGTRIVGAACHQSRTRQEGRSHGVMAREPDLGRQRHCCRLSHPGGRLECRRPQSAAHGSARMGAVARKPNGDYLSSSNSFKGVNILRRIVCRCVCQCPRQSAPLSCQCAVREACI